MPFISLPAGKDAFLRQGRMQRGQQPLKACTSYVRSMNQFLFAGLLGGIGGLARSTVGLSKALARGKKVVWKYWGSTIVLAVLIGIFAGIVFNFDYRANLLAGYAGTDILEGTYKSLIRK